MTCKKIELTEWVFMRDAPRLLFKSLNQQDEKKFTFNKHKKNISCDVYNLIRLIYLERQIH